MSKKIVVNNQDLYSRIRNSWEEIIERNINIDYKGHFPFEKEYLLSEMRYELFTLSEEVAQALLDGQKLAIPHESTMGIRQCPYCAEYINLSFDGQNLAILKKCPNPGGFTDVTVELNIPSGKMVFANDLRQWFKIHGSYNINLDVGIFQTIKAYEKVGMAHGFVGNTSPGIFQEHGRALTISASPVEDEWDEVTHKSVERDPNEIQKETPLGEEIGGICTDLWWYSIVDLDDFKIRFLDMGGTKQEFKKFLKMSCTVADVVPGVFRVQHFFIRTDQVPAGAPLNYAKITWACNPEQSNLYEKYKKMNRTLGQCYLVAVKEYPTLHAFKEEELPSSLTQAERVKKLLTFSAERIECSFQRFLDHTFCTLGGGTDWHRNGWGTTVEVPEDTPDFQMPKLTKRYSWYPMSREYCALYLGAFGKTKRGEKISFNESFLAAAYNVIHSMLQYGVDTYEQTKGYEREAHEQIEIAQKSLNALSIRYPNSVPDYCRDLAQM